MRNDEGGGSGRKKRSPVKVWPQIGPCEDLVAMDNRNVRRLKQKYLREIRKSRKSNSDEAEDNTEIMTKMEENPSESGSTRGRGLSSDTLLSDDDTIVVRQQQKRSLSSSTPPDSPSVQRSLRKRSKTRTETGISPLYSLPRMPKRTQPRATRPKDYRRSSIETIVVSDPVSESKSLSSDQGGRQEDTRPLTFRAWTPAGNRFRDVFSRSPPQSLRMRDRGLTMRSESQGSSDQRSGITRDIQTKLQFRDPADTQQPCMTYSTQDSEADECPLQSVENRQDRHREPQHDIFDVPMSPAREKKTANSTFQQPPQDIFDAPMSPGQPGNETITDYTYDRSLGVDSLVVESQDSSESTKSVSTLPEFRSRFD